MGGSISVTVRETNGNEHRMCRWTNAMPGFINNINFVNKDQKHLDEYLAQWTDFVADYKKNKRTKKFEHNMTPCYAPYPYLAPLSYGQVVIDYKNDVVLTCQGYCGFGHLHGPGIRLDMRMQDGPYGKAYALKKFFEVKRIKRIWFWDVAKKKDYSSEEIPQTFEELTKVVMLEDTYDFPGPVECLGFDIDMSPFKIIEFKETPEGFSEMREFIKKDLEFNLSVKEEKRWDDFIKERE